ncbi:MAG: TonB-dependent receptor [Gammaproteobacteria bacterium]
MNRSHTVFGRSQVGAAVADILVAARSRTFATRAQAACAIALVGVGAGNLAHAQEASGAAADKGGGVLSVEEITVTGSRIRRTTDFDTANPTTVVDSTYLKNLGIVNVGDAVKQLPSNLSNNTPTTTGNANFFLGSTIANLRGLNPFFGSRTLNLINNRRFVPTNQGDGVDLNFIPSIMIDRVDIVTGGASAAYGSGAISGVNNIFLARKLEGGKAQVDFAQTGESDGDDKHVAFAYGQGLFADRGHFVVGYEFQDSQAVKCFSGRDWCQEGNGIYQNTGALGAPPGPAPNPQQILGTNLHQNQISTTGVFYTTNKALTQTFQGTADGTGTQVFNLGQQPFAGGLPTNVVPGGDGRSIYQYTNLRAPVKRNVAAGTFTYELTDSTNMSVDLSYGKVETVNITGAQDATNQRILNDSAFLSSASLLAAQQAVRVTPGNPALQGQPYAALNKDWTSQVDSQTEFTTDVKRIALGFDGTFGQSSWSWDTYYQYGKTSREQFVQDNRHLIAYLMATDAVVGANGQIQCRVTRDGYAAAVAANPTYATVNPSLAVGCVPLNPFGNGVISQAAHDYSFGSLDEKLDYEQQVLAASASGDVWEGFGAGPIQAAVGGEYRMEKGENIAASGIPDAVRQDYLVQYGESFAGDVDVAEGFLETNIPVLKDAPFAKKLEFNTAARLSRYDNQGKFGTSGLSQVNNIFTWKVSGIWDPVEWLRFRGSQSRDSRAANFRELYYRQVISGGGAFAFCGPVGTNTDPCNYDLRGNVLLRPEKADTTTLGLVLRPKDLIPGFEFAADYFRIDLQDSINQAGARIVLDACNYGKGDPAACAQLVRTNPAADPNYTDIQTLNSVAYNGKGYTYKGVDVTTSYLWSINDVDSINFRLLGTRMIDQKFQTLAILPVYNVVGQTGTSNNFLTDNTPAPKWLGNLSATWNHGPISLTGQGRYVSSGKINSRGFTQNADGTFPTPIVGGVTISDNHVPSYAIFGLSGSYQFDNVGPTKDVQIFAVVDNLFDRDPPIAPGSGQGGNVNGGTNAIYFDTLGRVYRLGFRTNF